MEHTVEKMAQQVHIISWVKVGKVEELLGGTEGVVNVMVYMLYMYKMYRQKKVKNFEKKLEEVASPGFVKSSRGLNDFSSCSAFSFTRRDLGVYHWLCSGPGDGQNLREHIARHAGCQSGC